MRSLGQNADVSQQLIIVYSAKIFCFTSTLPLTLCQKAKRGVKVRPAGVLAKTAICQTDYPASDTIISNNEVDCFEEMFQVYFQAYGRRSS